MSDNTKLPYIRFKDRDDNSIFSMKATSVPDAGTTVFITDWHGQRAEYWVLKWVRESIYPTYDVTVVLKEDGEID